MFCFPMSLKLVYVNYLANSSNLIGIFSYLRRGLDFVFDTGLVLSVSSLKLYELIIEDLGDRVFSPYLASNYEVPSSSPSFLSSKNGACLQIAS